MDHHHCWTNKFAESAPLETTIIRDNRLPAHPLPFQAVRCEKAFVRLHSRYAAN
jgi:hypothetical protein